MPLDTLAARNARYRSGELALVCGPHRLTHDAVNRRANRTANALLGLGFAKDERVALVLDNCLELLDLYGAAMKTGIVVVPLSPLLRAEGLRQLLADSGASVIVTAPRPSPELDRARGELAIDHWLVAGEAEGYRPLGELTAAAPDEQPPDAGLRDDDAFNIIYSSGTTGDPKGIVHTHRIREAYATGFASSCRIHRDSVVLHAGSLVFNGSFVTLMPALYLGCP